MTSDAPAWIAAVGGFAATVVGTVNYILTRRFTRQSEMQRWTRESLNTTFSDFLEAVDGLHGRCLGMAVMADKDQKTRLGVEAMDFSESIVRAARVLELAAPGEVSKVVQALLTQNTYVFVSAIEPAQDFADQMAKAKSLRTDFLIAVRRAMGIELGAPTTGTP